MKPGVWRERLLALFFIAAALAMAVAGVLLEQVPETLFNATLV